MAPPDLLWPRIKVYYSDLHPDPNPDPNHNPNYAYMRLGHNYYSIMIATGCLVNPPMLMGAGGLT